MSAGRLSALIERSGYRKNEVAARLGITDRMLQYYLSGSPIPYPVQFCIESLAA